MPGTQTTTEAVPEMQLQSLSWWSEAGQNLVQTYGPKLLAGLAVLIIGWIVARILCGILRRVMARAKVDATLAGFTGNMVYMTLLTLVVISAISAAGFPSTSFVAVIGAAGVAIGLALQGSLANFAAGVMLILFRPFKAGDFIEAGGATGTVEEVHVFATTLKTPDNKRIIVPNAGITGGNITNFSAKEIRRVDLVFGIGYGDDLQRAKDVLVEILRKDECVLADPAPVIAVLELADSSVNLAVRPWVKTADYWDVYFEVTEKVKREFDAQGVSIPFPQRDIHIHQVPVAG